MTLNTRNKLLLVFSIASAVCAAVFAAAFLYAFIKKIPAIQSLFLLPETSGFFRLFLTPNYIAAFFSLVLFSLFVPAAGFAVYFNFEKTQSLEVLFFSAFLIGVLCESFKLCIPLFGLTAGYSGFLRLIGQVSFFGQIEILLTIIVQGAFAAGAESRESDKYLGFVLIISFMFSIIMPLNTTVFENYVTVSYGFKGLFDAIRAAFTLCTFLIFLLSAKSTESNDYKKAAVDFFAVCCGYMLLSRCTNFALLLPGALLLGAGSVRFLKNMHRYYMWK